jgi:hypothetical protein
MTTCIGGDNCWKTRAKAWHNCEVCKHATQVTQKKHWVCALCWPKFYMETLGAGYPCCEGIKCIKARDAESTRRQAASTPPAPVRDDQLQLPPAALPPAPAPAALPPARTPAALPLAPPAEEMAAMLRELVEEVAALKRQMADMCAAAALPNADKARRGGLRRWDP